MAPHPLSAQCSATSKTTGQRCRRRTIACPVCQVHGSKAPQVAARRAARLVAYEASLAATTTPRDPGEALLDAAQTADQIARQIRVQLATDGRLDAATLTALGEWLDRTGRLCAVVLSAKVNERLVAVEEFKTQMLVTALGAVFAMLELSEEREAEAVRVLMSELRRLEAGGRPALTVAGELDD